MRDGSTSLFQRRVRIGSPEKNAVIENGVSILLLNSTGFDDAQIKKSESFPYAVIGARVAGDARAA